jgi:hypothetical protein
MNTTSESASQTADDFADPSVSIFSTHHDAEAAIKTLSAAGFDMKDLSIIGREYHTEEHPVGFVNTGDRMFSYGKYGAFWGTVWGLLFGSAFMLVPGVGPFVFAGYIVAAIEGAFLGGGLGVLAGALTSIGVPEGSVVKYEAALKAGSFLLIARGSPSEVQRAKDILGAKELSHA